MLPEVDSTAEPVMALLAFPQGVIARQHPIRHGLFTAVIAEDETLVLAGGVRRDPREIRALKQASPRDKSWQASRGRVPTR